MSLQKSKSILLTALIVLLTAVGTSSCDDSSPTDPNQFPLTFNRSSISQLGGYLLVADPE